MTTVDPAKRTARQDTRPFVWHDLAVAAKNALLEIKDLISSMVAAGDREECEARQRREAGGCDDRGPSLEWQRVSRLIFLSAERGAGKSSLLLSLQSALQTPGFFLKGEATSAEAPADIKYKKLDVDLELLGRRIVWVDTLDLDPLPLRTNLLAALLLRIERAVEREWSPDELHRDSECRTQGDRAPAAGRVLAPPDVWRRIQSLVGKGARAWDHGGAQTMSDATDDQRFLVEFGDDLRKTLGSAGKEIARRRGLGRDKPCVFLIPLDDVDLNPARGRELLDLVRLISGPQVICIAAGHEDDLRRAVEQELLAKVSKLGDGVLAISESVDAEPLTDQIVRVAAAALRKLVPPQQIVRMGPWSVEEALSFRPDGATKSLEDLLRLTTLHNGTGQWPQTLWDIITPDAHLVGLGYRPCDTVGWQNVARQALSLTPRILLDLYASCVVYSTASGTTASGAPGAAELAGDMVTALLRELPLPGAVRKRLGSDVVVRRADGYRLLGVDEFLTSGIESGGTIVLGGGPTKLGLRVEKPVSHRISVQEPPSDRNRRQRATPVPEPTVGWLVLLHDAVAFDSRARRDGNLAPSFSIGAIKTVVDLPFEDLLLSWPLPDSFCLAETGALFDLLRRTANLAATVGRDGDTAVAVQEMVALRWLRDATAICQGATIEDVSSSGTDWWPIDRPWNEFSTAAEVNAPLDAARQALGAWLRAVALAASSGGEMRRRTRNWLSALVPSLKGPEHPWLDAFFAVAFPGGFDLAAQKGIDSIRDGRFVSAHVTRAQGSMFAGVPAPKADPVAYGLPRWTDDIDDWVRIQRIALRVSYALGASQATPPHASVVDWRALAEQAGAKIDAIRRSTQAVPPDEAALMAM